MPTCRHICAKHQPVWRKCPVQLIKHDSWFDAHTAGDWINLQNFPTFCAEINHHRMIDRLPCQRSSATARKNWNPQLSANSNCLNSIRNRIWNHNSERFYLIQTRISRIKHAIVLAESNLAIDCRRELMLNRMTNCIRRIILQAPILQLAILENSEMNVCCHSEWIACKKY